MPRLGSVARRGVIRRASAKIVHCISRTLGSEVVLASRIEHGNRSRYCVSQSLMAFVYGKLVRDRDDKRIHNGNPKRDPIFLTTRLDEFGGDRGVSLAREMQRQSPRGESGLQPAKRSIQTSTDTPPPHTCPVSTAYAPCFGRMRRWLLYSRHQANWIDLMYRKVRLSTLIAATLVLSGLLQGCVLAAGAAAGAAGGYEAKKQGYEVQSPVRKDSAGGGKVQSPAGNHTQNQNSSSTNANGD